MPDRMMSRWVELWVSALLCFWLGGCDTVPKTILVSCVDDRVPRPGAYADAPEAMLAAPDAAGRLQLIATANEQRKSRLAIVEPVIEACR